MLTNNQTFRGRTAVITDRLTDTATHLLIAGATGSGKSVFEANVINSLMFKPVVPALFLIDPKRIDLDIFRPMRNVIGYADTVTDSKRLLIKACEVMDSRYSTMKRKGQRVCEDRPLYVVIDELADLVLQDKAIFEPLHRLLAVGRASNVRVVMCTQLVNAQVLPTLCRANVSATVALHCESAHTSRLLLGAKGAEDLPRYGEAIIKDADGLRRVEVPYISDDYIDRLVDYWRP